MKWAKDLTRCPTKEDTQITAEKILMSLGNCKLNRQLDTTAHLLKWQEIWNTDNTKCWWGCRAMGTLIHGWWEYKGVQSLWKTACFLQNWTQSYHTIQQLWSLVFTQMTWKHFHTKTCTQIFIGTSFIVAKTWMWQRCPSLGKRIINRGTSSQWNISQH